MLHDTTRDPQNSELVSDGKSYWVFVYLTTLFHIFGLYDVELSLYVNDEFHVMVHKYNKITKKNANL